MTDDDYLATGFRDVDGAGASDVYIECLTLLDSLPFYDQVKHQSYDLMDLGEARRVLDAGCGLGFDVFRMAAQLGPRGQAVGLDASTALIEKARNDPRAKRLPISFCAGDLKALPFCDGAFDRCRIDRVLQHVPQPGTAIAELARVLQPGGMLLAYDNDWRTFKITPGDEMLTPKVEMSWCSAFANSEIGRQLPSLFEEAGLRCIEERARVSVIEDFEIADKVYNIRQTVDRLTANGEVAFAAGRAWIEGLQEHAACGRFSVTLTAHTVTGHKDR